MNNNILTVEELLFNDEPITINRKLAKCLGITEAVIFQQIHYWLKFNEKSKNNFKDGKYWTYNSVSQWQENEFDFLSKSTIQRKLLKLEQIGLLETGMYNKLKGDKTKWYTIDYNKLLEVCKKELFKKENLSEVRKQAGLKGNEIKKTMNATCDYAPSTQLATMVNATCDDDKRNLLQPIPKITTKTSTKTSISSSKEEKCLIKIFENNICELKETTRRKFLNFCNQYDYEFIKAILEYGIDNNAKAYSWFEKTINANINKEITTKSDFIADIESFRESKRKNNGDSKKTNFHNIENERQYDYEDLESKLLGEKELEPAEEQEQTNPEILNLLNKFSKQ